MVQSSEMPTVDLRADLKANRGDPRGTFVVLAFRAASEARKRLPRPIALPVLLAYKLVISWVMGVDIPASTHIGPGLRLQHPYGITIHPHARLGRDCRVNQAVTVGKRDGQGAPIIGDHVLIGSGAQVLGPLTVGDGAVIGSGAIVVDDVPEDWVAVGPRATVRPRSGRHVA
jgi:putative colanic acid biosynthesis acetyltransferase WcaB